MRHATTNAQRTVHMLAVSLCAACGCASEVTPSDDGSAARDVPAATDVFDATVMDLGTPPVDAGCASSCAPGQVCVHEFYTHDPPPPQPDGSPCTAGTPAFGRCWNVQDRCETPPSACTFAPTCSCPPLSGGPLYPQGCSCESDGTLTCYFIGI